jgi:6-phosphofructokinase 1
MIKGAHGYKCQWSVADYLQRAARHIASATDVAQAYAVGEAAVQFALEGKNAVMPVIKRKKNEALRMGDWRSASAPCSKRREKDAKVIHSEGWVWYHWKGS